MEANTYNFRNVLRLVAIAFAISVSQEISAQATTVSAEREITMSATTANSSSGAYRYYKEGETEPFTGILFARYANGNYKSRQEFVDGIGQGTWINYWPNGNLKEAGSYNQNKVEGPISKYYENGQLKAKGNYKDWRIRIGEWEYYDESGQLILTEDYGSKGDFRDVLAYYKSGQISEERYLRIINE